MFIYQATRRHVQNDRSLIIKKEVASALGVWKWLLRFYAWCVSDATVLGG